VSFTAEDILTEFAEASRYGRVDMYASVEGEFARRAHRLRDACNEYMRVFTKRPATKSRRNEKKRQRTTWHKAIRVRYDIAPTDPVRSWPCECGGRVELRPGATRTIHVGPIGCRRPSVSAPTQEASQP